MKDETLYVPFYIEKNLPLNPKILQYDEYYVEFDELLRKGGKNVLET